MNYIEELLRRQAAAFAALLRGGEETDLTRERTAGTDSVRGQNGEREAPAGMGMAEWNRRLAERSARAYGETPLPVGAAEGRISLRRWTAGLTPQREPTAETLADVPTDTETGAADGWERSGGGPETSAGDGRTLRRDGNASVCAATAPGGGGAMSAAGNGWERSARMDRGASAEELSREFERDARRYDGGYPLY